MASSPKAKTFRQIMIASLAFWIFAWVVESLLDYIFFYEEYQRSFIELLITDVPPHELYIRFLLLVLFLIFGAIAGLLATRYERTSKELRDREEHFRITLDSIGDAVISTDIEGRVVRMNPVAEELTGHSLKKVAGRPLTEVFNIVNSRTREPAENPVGKVLESGAVVGLANHTVLIGKHGQEFQIADSGAPIRDDQGKVNGVVLVFRDVTDEYRLSQELEQSEKKHRELYNSIRDAILVVDIDRNIIDCNLAFTGLFGYSAEEIFGQKTLILYDDPEEYRGMGELLNKSIEDDNFFFTVRYRKKSGEVFPGETNVFYIRDGEDNVTGFIGLIRDITERKETEGRLSFQATLLNQIQDMITATDLAGHVTYVNEAECRAFGKSAEEMIGRHVDSFGEDPERGATQDEIIEASLAEGHWRGEVINYGPDGTEYVLDSRTHLIYNDAGEKIGIVGISTDITERKKMEEALQENRDMLHRILEATGDGILCAGVDGSVMFANQRFSDVWKVSSQAMATGDRFRIQEEIRSQLEAPDAYFASVEDLYQSKHPDYSTFSFKDGRVFERYSWPVIKDGGLIGRVWSFREVTERVRAEESLSRRLELERTVSEISSEFVGLPASETDAGINNALKAIGEFSGADRAYVFLFRSGWSADNTHEWCAKGIEPQIENLKSVPVKEELPFFHDFISNMKIFYVADVEDLPEEVAPEKEHFCDQGIKSLAVVPLSRGEEVIGFLGFDSVGEKRHWSEDDQTLLLLVGQTITHALERKRSEEALQESEAKYRLIAEHTADVVWSSVVRDGEFKNIYVSPSIERFRGYTPSEHLNQSMEEILTPESLQNLNREIEKALLQSNSGGGLPDTLKMELEYNNKDGGTVISEININVSPDPAQGLIWITGVTRDITDRKRMEAEQQRAAKLESLGILAGGLAHDFNNILQALWGNISLLAMKEDLSENAQLLVSDAEKACRRASGLTRQLLTFAKGGEPVTKSASVKDLITESVNFYLRGSNVMPVFDLPDDLLSVEIDPEQISQVIQNLVINADHAMPQGGKIEIRARNVGTPIKEAAWLEDGEYVSISFTDQGTGIPEEYISKIFDPYFTTKQKGSGLGLATAYSIIKRHKGHIEVYSSPGQGTNFNIYLPAAKPKEKPEKHEDQGPSTQGKKILVMDDDDMIRNIYDRLLTMQHHEVHQTREGKEAVEVFRHEKKAGRPFDMVILDLTVPGGMGGKDAILKLLEIDKNVKAVVASGYSNDPVIARHQEYGFVGAIKKPFDFNELNRVLAEVFG